MRFLYNMPAILHKGALIIGDIHFGMEGKLKQRGIFSNDFSERLAEKIIALLKKTKARKLIILGDVKEDITYLDEYTIRAFEMIKKEFGKKRDCNIKEFKCKNEFEGNKRKNELEGKKDFEIIIVRGNHDGGIEGLGLKVVPSEGFVYKGIGLVHGHSWPSEECMNAEYIISAHQHPQIEFFDLMKKRHVEQVWVIADANRRTMSEHYKKLNKKIKLILIPAFNPIVGNPIKNELKSNLGPILNNKLFKWNDANVYRLNGVAVGKLSRILRCA